MTEKPGTTPGSIDWKVKECEDMIRRSLRTPMAKFLRENLEKAGCGVKENFFKTVNCKDKFAGSYIRRKGIIVCANHMKSQDDTTQVVAHELIRAYDDCRAVNLNWANCAHHACSEIRAGHLSGDCHYKRELLRGYIKLKGHEPECVRRSYEISDCQPILLRSSCKGCHGSCMGCLLQRCTAL